MARLGRSLFAVRVCAAAALLAGCVMAGCSSSGGSTLGTPSG